MKLKEKEKLINLSILASSFLFFFYTVLRAVKVPITYDESFTLFNFVKTPFTILYDNANNHLLNSIFLRISIPIFGESEFALRIPNLAFHIVFLYFSYKFLKKYFGGFTLIPVFILLNINPFLMEFFSLARGYGISMGLLMAGIYFFSEVIDKNAYFSKQAFFAIGLIALSLTANLNILNFYLGAIAVLYLFFAIDSFLKSGKIELQKLIFNKLVLYSITISPAIAVIFTGSILLMKAHDQLFFGGEKGFWEDTVHTLIQSSLYSNQISPNILSFFEIIVFVLIFLVTLGFIYFLLAKPNIKYKKFYIFLFASTSLAVASTILQFNILGTKYLIERTALFFVPLFTILVIFIIQTLFKKFSVIVFCLTTMFSILYFLSTINFQFSIFWPFEQSSEKIVEDINNLTSRYEAHNCIVSRYIYGSSIEYYIYRLRPSIERMYILEYGDFNSECNFYVLYNDDTPPNSNLVKVKEYPSKATLYTKSY